jgi:hypothetical protein
MQRVDGLLDLQPVAAGAPQGAVHRRQQGNHRQTVAPTQFDHRLRQLESALYLWHERA